MAAWIQAAMQEAAKECAPGAAKSTCRFQGASGLFSAGPDRGGSGLGGPFWTDFAKVHAQAAQPSLPGVVQVVGHTPSPCDTDHSPGCQPVRYAPRSQVLDVDVAMVYGNNQGYLELTPGGDLVIHRRVSHNPEKWDEVSVTANECQEGSQMSIGRSTYTTMGAQPVRLTQFVGLLVPLGFLLFVAYNILRAGQSRAVASAPSSSAATTNDLVSERGLGGGAWETTSLGAHKENHHLRRWAVAANGHADAADAADADDVRGKWGSSTTGKDE
mmetsp:Transcript_23305/g.68020  ORF Transcript_23305/g.68020 Transcript_23305/m.68020 type:complete len:272 (-) Transcript_23305:37-852(-)